MLANITELFVAMFLHLLCCSLGVHYFLIKFNKKCEDGRKEVNSKWMHKLFIHLHKYFFEVELTNSLCLCFSFNFILDSNFSLFNSSNLIIWFLNIYHILCFCYYCCCCLHFIILPTYFIFEATKHLFLLLPQVFSLLFLLFFVLLYFCT